LFGGLSLIIADEAVSAGTHGDGYPAARLQRGLLLACPGRDLAEEGVGFGVPVLKRGAQTVFAGAMELRQGGKRTPGSDGAQAMPSGDGEAGGDARGDGEAGGDARGDGEAGGDARGDSARGDWRATAVFEMNLVERLAARDRAGSGPGAGRGSGPGGGPRSRSFYAVRDALAALHRRVPPLRDPLTAISNAVRRGFGLVTAFEETATVATLPVTYDVRGGEGRVHVTVDLTGLPADGLSEVVVMNELGARCFDQYRDSGGTRLRGAAIGTWTRVTAARASLLCGAVGVGFSLEQAPGARLYRGRELVGSRLAWAGFGYAVRRGAKRFRYDVRFEPVERAARPDPLERDVRSDPLERGTSERHESAEPA